MLELFRWLADSRFMPHGMCYLWQPDVVWLHVISDSVTVLAYYSIAFDLFFFVRRRKDLPFHWIFIIFGVFILGCGTTHLMEVVTIWHPVYRLSGLIKLLTAIASVGAAVSLFLLLSRVLALRGAAQFERINRRLDHKVMAGFGLALATLVAVGVLQYRTVQTLVETDRQVAHAHAVLAQLEGAFSGVKDAESSGRGYVATGDEHFIRPIDLSIGDIQGHLGSLGSLTAGHPRQQHNVDKLAPLVERTVTFTERLMLVRRDQGFDAATRLMRQGEGLRLMSEIRALVEAMKAEENGSLQARLAASRAGARKAGAVVALGTLLALVLLLAASWVIHRDIIRWRRAEEARSYLVSIVESSEDAIIGKRLDGTMVSWNPGAERLYGYTAEEAIGRPISMLLPPERADDTLDILEKIKRGEGVERYETKRLRKDGGETEVSITVSPIRNTDGRVVGASAIARDITERRRAEEALAQKAKELARSNADLEQFAYVASHDLQEPLRMVASFTQLLARRYRGKLDADADEFIGYAVDGARRMQILIDNLLAYSRVGARGKEFVPTSAAAVLEAALQNLEKAIEETGARVTHDPLPTVPADPTQLCQVFQNLVGNALKFHGPEPPRVHVSAQPGDGEWRFSVRDNGIGIDPQHAERIFMIFQRLHTSAAYPGAGIGLAISKNIVERHGGRVWVESAPAKGATFYFTIPIEGRGLPRPEAGPRVGPRMGDKR